MCKTGRTSKMATEMRRYNLMVLRIGETHSTQTEQKRLGTGDMLLYSGHEEENASHTGNCSDAVQRCTKRIYCVGLNGLRIIKAYFKGRRKVITMNSIQCFATTKDSNDDGKDQFYGKLQTLEDVRTRREAEIDSDHCLVVTKMKLKLKKHWTSMETALQKFIKVFVRHADIRYQLKIAINNRLQALQDLLKGEETTMKERGIRSTNFNMSGGSWPQQASSQRIDLYRKPRQN
ncbi:unnamed protein product [Schistosoma margrebowiei]|uniref:Uncharacterized protein n=1 Tax=Schistosoma margrebowiei TaxID=48269 RepID=A0A183MWC5_9TREM|nr:unnamed protein product [Schistosoma margrebowiei]